MQLDSGAEPAAVIEHGGQTAHHRKKCCPEEILLSDGKCRAPRAGAPGRSTSRSAAFHTTPLAAVLGIAILAALWVAGEAGAQRRGLRFEHLSLAEGRSQITVTCILQERTGFFGLGIADRLHGEGLSPGIAATPPVWRPGWFQLSVLLALAAAAVVAYKLKTRSLRKHHERLEALVRERTSALEEAREQLLRRERLATLGELAGSVAHEIRNPLGVIKNSIYFLRLTQKLTDAKAVEHLGLIDREVDRSNRIITELLDYARNPTLETRRLRLPEVVDKALAELEIPAAVTVERKVDQASLAVEADAGQIERILTNLLANAVQAMPDGGSLRVECRRRGDEAIVEVADTGVGIEEESLSKIFEPLFTSKAYGIGLGLALSQRYAELNRGRIECETRLGQGTTFRLVLPLAADDGGG